MDITRIGIVILNYLAYEATIQCVSCFMKLPSDGIQMEIVIVDNASTNDSYNKLMVQYEEVEHVHIYRTKQNLGFAKGNNYGYEKLKELGAFDYVIVSNDDILFDDSKMYKWILACDKKYSFGVLGPQIYSLGGQYQQSPLDNFSRDHRKLRKIAFHNRKILWKLRMKRLLRMNPASNSAYEKWNNQSYHEEHLDMTLHGSFLIFSKRYFAMYEQPFEPDTFLYMEEYLLKLRCDLAQLNMVFSPEYQVKHLQSQSTKEDKRETIVKMIRRQKCFLESLKIYRNKLKDL